jgi:hypothetical protein
LAENIDRRRQLSQTRLQLCQGFQNQVVV